MHAKDRERRIISLRGTVRIICPGTAWDKRHVQLEKPLFSGSGWFAGVLPSLDLNRSACWTLSSRSGRGATSSTAIGPADSWTISMN
jgi:hypothetical protein